MITLRPYQQELIQAIRASIAKGNRRIIVQLATGGGKSPVIGSINKSAIAKHNRVINVLPRRSLVNQLAESFAGWGINFGTVMSGKKQFSQPLSQIVSIDTYQSRLASDRLKHIDGDILIADEMQLQFTKKKLEIFDKYKTVLAFSATPIAPRGQALGDFYDDIVSVISISELMEQGYLSKLKYYADPSIDTTGIKSGRDGDYLESKLGEVMDKPKLVGDIFKNWFRIAKGKQTVIFASSQSHARHICNEFNEHGFKFLYVDCNTPDDERKIIFDAVSSGQAMGIVNCGIVSVGIDIPCLECVVLARPTKLITVYHQCVGRVTRLHPDKHDGGIVIDHAGIIDKLGFVTDHIEWTLDGKESAEERQQKSKEDKKEPKVITCHVCNFVFTGARKCPSCGHELIPSGEPIPVHSCELKEIVKPEKHSSEYKELFYRQLLGYARRNNKRDGFAYYKYKEKFGVGPAWKKIAQEPGQDVINYIQSRNIAYAKGKVRQ